MTYRTIAPLLILLALSVCALATTPYAGYFTYRSSAIILVALTALAGFCIDRTCKRWKQIGAWRRVYGLATIGVSTALLISFVAQTVRDPMFAPGYLRAIWVVHKLGGTIGIAELRDQSVSVHLSGSHVTDAELRYLEPFRVWSLTLLETQVTDAGLQHLRGMTSLNTLHLTGAGLLKIRPHLTDLGLP